MLPDTPTVHLNGTSRQMLLDDTEKMAEAALALRHAMQRVEFNCRDYYVRGPEAWPAAVDERRRIQMLVEQVIDHIDQLANEIYEQKGGRA